MVNNLLRDVVLGDGWFGRFMERVSPMGGVDERHSNQPRFHVNGVLERSWWVEGFGEALDGEDCREVACARRDEEDGGEEDEYQSVFFGDSDGVFSVERGEVDVVGPGESECFCIVDTHC